MDRVSLAIVNFLVIALFTLNGFAGNAGQAGAAAEKNAYELGRRMYLDGILPSGELMSGMIQNDIEVSGDQVKCGACHRPSGMGSTEGQQVVPAVTGKILFEPLQLPASKPPATPILRLAYTRETLKRAIRTGIDANGKLLDPNMPRYPLDDSSLDLLIDYLDTLSVDFSPGVDQHDIHFATIVSDSVGPKKKKALLDVMQTFIEQKNVETRHETERAEHAPWHKEWIFKPYRKWVLHVWELQGPRETWAKQLNEYYAEHPVFAVLSGVVSGSWEPIHDFCQDNKIPCLFPTTDLPVIAEKDYYPIYMSRGMTLEGEGIAAHIADDMGIHGQDSVVQVYDPEDELAKTAATSLKMKLKDKADLHDIEISTVTSNAVKKPFDLPDDSILVVWGDQHLLNDCITNIEDVHAIKRIYLSTTLYGVDAKQIPEGISDITYFINPQEMPGKLARLILRSTGWLRAKRIYAPDEKRIQANAYFALKVTGSALRVIRGYFYRDYFIERVENAIDNAPYTSVYPHIGLAPGQRFVSKGFYMAKMAEGNASKLVNVTEWTTP
jgi:hypothetical protein